MMRCPHCKDAGGRFYVHRTITDVITVECDADGTYEVFPVPQSPIWEKVVCAACWRESPEHDARAMFRAAQAVPE